MHQKEKKGEEEIADLKRYRSERDALRKSGAILEKKMILLQRDLNKKTTTLDRVREERDLLHKEPNTDAIKPFATPSVTSTPKAPARPHSLHNPCLPIKFTNPSISQSRLYSSLSFIRLILTNTQVSSTLVFPDSFLQSHKFTKGNKIRMKF